MNLRLYIENIHRQLAVAAEVGGEDARALAERLMAPLDAALQLTLQDALAEAAEEITCDLAPGSVDVRLRGRDLEFVVTQPPVDAPSGHQDDAGQTVARSPEPEWGMAPSAPAGADAEEGAMSRINLRMPDHLKARIEQAASREGLSVNAWLVRAATAALEPPPPNRPSEQRAPWGAQRYTGWVR